MLLAVFSAFYFGAFAQITITNAVFPAAGDTLQFAIDAQPDGSINVATPPGGNQLWDFSSLQLGQTLETIYQPASAGSDVSLFGGADLVVIGQAGETYFNVTNTKFDVLGYSGADPANFGLNVVAKFGPAVTERRAPMNFFDINSQSTDLSLPFSTDQLPDSLFSGLPIQPDSIRVRISTDRLEVVDGWGTCKIPGGQYPVLRQKRSEYTTTGLDVKVPFLGWIDLSTLLGGGGGGGLGGFLGTDTTITYRFYSGTEKEEIAVATMSNDLSTVESVRYKNNGLVDAVTIDAPGTAAIQAFPNPAVEWVRFDCSNLPAEDYTLKIFNIVGRVVWKENYHLTGNKSIRIELEHFKKGTYLYSLVDSKGYIIGTKRLVVLKP